MKLVDEDMPNVVKYNIKIFDQPHSALIVLVATGRVNNRDFKTTENIGRTELSEADYNIVAWKINRLSKALRRMIEHEIIDPVLKLEQIYLPEGWDSYEGPRWLLDKRRGEQLVSSTST